MSIGDTIQIRIIATGFVMSGQIVEIYNRFFMVSSKSFREHNWGRDKIAFYNYGKHRTNCKPRFEIVESPEFTRDELSEPSWFCEKCDARHSDAEEGYEHMGLFFCDSECAKNWEYKQ